MSSNGPSPITTDDVASAAAADNHSTIGVMELGDEFVRLSTFLRQRAEEVSALALRATSAEDRCVALAQGQEEREREVVALRDELDKVNARVIEFQAAGRQHLAEMQHLTEDYAKRVAASERASEALQNHNTELRSQLTTQEERNAQLMQRIAAAVLLEPRAAEAMQSLNLILDGLRTLDDSDGQPSEHTPARVPPSASAISALRTSAQEPSIPLPQTAPARGWYGLSRKAN